MAVPAENPFFPATCVFFGGKKKKWRRVVFSLRRTGSSIPRRKYAARGTKGKGKETRTRGEKGGREGEKGREEKKEGDLGGGRGEIRAGLREICADQHASDGEAETVGRGRAGKWWFGRKERRAREQVWRGVERERIGAVERRESTRDFGISTGSPSGSPSGSPERTKGLSGERGQCGPLRPMHPFPQPAPRYSARVTLTHGFDYVHHTGPGQRAGAGAEQADMEGGHWCVQVPAYLLNACADARTHAC